MQRADPVAVTFDPGGRIRRFKVDLLALDRQGLLHLVSDDGDIFAQHPHLNVGEINGVQRPASCLEHVGKLLLADAGDALCAGYQTRIISEAHRRLHIAVLDRVPILLLALNQLRFDWPFRHRLSLVGVLKHWRGTSPCSSVSFHSSSKPRLTPVATASARVVTPSLSNSNSR